MAVTATWTDPSTGSTLDKATGATMSEAYFDTLCGNLKYLGGTLGGYDAHVYHDANQSLANTTLTVLAFNTEYEDTDTIHDAGANTRLTCKTAGRYIAVAVVPFDSNATGLRSAYITKNGSGTYVGFDLRTAVNGDYTILVVTTPPLNLIVNDYLEVFAKQNSGGALNVIASGEWKPRFGMVKVG